MGAASLAFFAGVAALGRLALPARMAAPVAAVRIPGLAAVAAVVVVRA